jgi:uncharacterized spore protein YtfJ
MNIKLNIKSMIKYELLTKKSYNNIDYGDVDDVMNLLYCIVISNNDIIMLYEEFYDIMKNGDKLSQEISDKFSKLLSYTNQFIIKENDDKENENKENNKKENKNKEIVYIKDIASYLVVYLKMDVNYVMNDLTIEELHLYIDAYNKKRKEELEEERLFAYLTMLPHIDAKKFDNPQKIYPFFWELEEENEEIKKTDEEIKNNFDEIMKNSKELIDRINNTNNKIQ